MNTVRLYNTMSRRVEELVPVRPGEVGLYCCGPTVYDYAHIGNLRKYVCDDLLRRTLEHAGYAVRHVMNVTDIDDKIIKAAPGGIDAIRRHTTPFREAFFEDTATLSILRPHVVCAATEHIDAMAALVAKLVESGHAYESEGSYYFRIAAYPEYGRLARLDTAGMMAGARVDVDEYEKGDVRDFALWKAARPDEPVWDTPIGPGRPGWHIECSAMSMEYLGEEFDIHTGGVDNIFPHHENEIAQSEGATGKPFAKYWMHNGHINVDNKKMSKSEGNFFMVRDILKEYDAEAVRLFMLSAHYRSPINFSRELIEQATSSLERLYTARNTALFNREHAPERAMNADEQTFAERAKKAVEAFDAAMSDDLNTADALAAIFEHVRDMNSSLTADSAREAIDAGLNALGTMTDVLGLLRKDFDATPDEVKALVEQSVAAKKAKDFALADQIRQEVLDMGYIIEDTPKGPMVKKA